MIANAYRLNSARKLLPRRLIECSICAVRRRWRSHEQSCNWILQTWNPAFFSVSMTPIKPYRLTRHSV